MSLLDKVNIRLYLYFDRVTSVSLKWLVVNDLKPLLVVYNKLNCYNPNIIAEKGS